MMPMCILGIPVTPEGYYLKNIPNALLELYAIDRPVTAYGSGKKKRELNGRSVSEKMEDFDTPSSTDIADAACEWERKYGGGARPSLGGMFALEKPEVRSISLEELKELGN